MSGVQFGGFRAGDERSMKVWIDALNLDQLEEIRAQPGDSGALLAYAAHRWCRLKWPEHYITASIALAAKERWKPAVRAGKPDVAAHLFGKFAAGAAWGAGWGLMAVLAWKLTQ